MDKIGHDRRHLTSNEVTRVAICALTFLRPAGLQKLLSALEVLDMPVGCAVSVVIVDNDPERSAEAIVTAAARASRHTICYVHEPARGISTARNAAVTNALDGGADWICFIDDDEWPDPAWLSEFMKTAESTSADIVTGGVTPVFEETPPDWIVNGGFFERRRHAHHEQMRYATTSTVLISGSTFSDRPPPLDRAPFDLAFGLSGGEDTHLFAELVAQGRTIVWCDTAHVNESIPASKVNARWMLQREYRRGQTLSLSLRRRQPTTWRYIRRLANAATHLAMGAGRTLVGVTRGRAGVMIGIHEVVFGVGMLTGLAGRRYAEYATTHGS